MHSRLNSPLRQVVFWASTLLIAGCASDSSMQRYVPQIVTPYRMDIQQGNFVTQEMVDKLAVGQTRDQVRFILGTPLLTDVFHANRWDYVFRFSRGWNQPERRKLIIYFDADSRVSKWEADLPAPAEGDAAAKPAAASPAKPAEPAPPAAQPGASATGGAQSAATAMPVAAAAAVAVPVVPPPQPDAPAPPAPATVPTSPAVAPAAPPLSPSVPAAPAAGPAAPPSVADIDRRIASASASASASPAPASPANAAPREVLATLEEWRAAWSARDVDRYLSMYAATFKPAAGLSRAKWEQLRRERLKRASFVVVKLVDPQVTVTGNDAAAIFTQVYESNTLKESGRKKLALVMAGDGKWRIREETFEK